MCRSAQTPPVSSGLPGVSGKEPWKLCCNEEGVNDLFVGTTHKVLEIDHL